MLTTTITDKELSEACVNWSNALIAISKAFQDEGADTAIKVANGALNSVYGYNLGPVLFKPTLASGEQTFRPTLEGALSYFVGHNNKYPLDVGFALNSWCKVKFETSASYIHKDMALWMGRATFINKDGDTVKVEKSLGFRRDEKGVLRIVLHHSSLPYQPE